jgi:hypothetical protein
MPRLRILLLAAFVSLSAISTQLSAALIEHNLVVEPNFVHEIQFGGGASVNEVESRLTIPLPELTLAPGDLLRVTLEFAGGKYLRRGPTPPDGYQQTDIRLVVSQDGRRIGAGATGDGGTYFAQAQNHLSQVVLEQGGESGYYVLSSQQLLNYAGASLGNFIDPTEPTDLTIERLLFELQMPTYINSSAGSFPYTTTTFAGNSIEILYTLIQFDPVPFAPVAVHVVPEPGTLSLFGAVTIAAVCCRRT